eukprot:6173222-Pleurochrysis_carterae.AAC.3
MVCGKRGLKSINNEKHNVYVLQRFTSMRDDEGANLLKMRFLGCWKPPRQIGFNSRGFLTPPICRRQTHGQGYRYFQPNAASRALSS